MTTLFAIVALWAAAEAVLFFLVADIPISYIAVRYGAKPALRAALWASAASAVGGVCLLSLATTDPTGMADLITALPAIDRAMIDAANADFGERSYLAMLTGSFSGIPYKLYGLAAADLGGVSGAAGWLSFAWASFAVRLPRFALVALLTALLSDRLLQRRSMRTKVGSLALCWTCFYLWYFSTMPG